MKARFDAMEAEGKIGPLDSQGNLKPRLEYPKWVNSPRGRILVQSQSEELKALAMDPVEPEKPNALAQERDSLAAQLAEAQAKIVALEAKPTGGVTPAPAAKPTLVPSTAAASKPALITDKPLVPAADINSLLKGADAGKTEKPEKPE